MTDSRESGTRQFTLAGLSFFGNILLEHRRTEFIPFVPISGAENGMNSVPRSRLASRLECYDFRFLTTTEFETHAMTDTPQELHVYQAGELTVVGFGGRDLLDQVNIASCREEIKTLIGQYGTKTLAIDLSGVLLIPSGMLGLLNSIRELGVEVQIYNPSADVREVLEITKLDEIFKIQNVDVASSADSDSSETKD